MQLNFVLVFVVIESQMSNNFEEKACSNKFLPHAQGLTSRQNEFKHVTKILNDNS